MSELREEWEELPHEGQQRLMITAAIPYNFRWRILQLKQMLYDLKYLAEKHGVINALALYEAVCNEAEELCRKMLEEINTKREWRKKYENNSVS